MLSTPFQLPSRNTLSVCWFCVVVVVVVVVVFTDIVVVALVSSSYVSACRSECNLDSDHYCISCVFISLSPLPSCATPHYLSLLFVNFKRLLTLFIPVC